MHECSKYATKMYAVVGGNLISSYCFMNSDGKIVDNINERFIINDACYAAMQGYHRKYYDGKPVTKFGVSVAPAYKYQKEFKVGGKDRALFVKWIKLLINDTVWSNAIISKSLRNTLKYGLEFDTSAVKADELIGIAMIFRNFYEHDLCRTAELFHKAGATPTEAIVLSYAFVSAGLKNVNGVKWYNRSGHSPYNFNQFSLKSYKKAITGFKSVYDNKKLVKDGDPFYEAIYVMTSELNDKDSELYKFIVGKCKIRTFKTAFVTVNYYDPKEVVTVLREAIKDIVL